jgi:hypothetical protein
MLKEKSGTRQSPDGRPVMGFADLMAHLDTMTRGTMRVPLRPKHRFTLCSMPIPAWETAFRLLDINPMRAQ